MMVTRKILAIFCLFGFCFSAPTSDSNKRVKRQDDDAEKEIPLTITKFHVNTTIKFRYAIT